MMIIRLVPVGPNGPRSRVWKGRDGLWNATFHGYWLGKTSHWSWALHWATTGRVEAWD